MVIETSRCDHDRLRQLIDGELPASVEADVTAHVETCPECQVALESLAGDQSWWTGTRDALSDAGESSDSRYRVAEGGSSDVFMKGRRWLRSPVQHDELAESSPVPVPLDFLAPSDNPAMLGRLGEFEILELIGCGGMGIVLKGYDHELNRFVAVKVLHPHCATSAAARRRFTREAQAAAAIVHQHVVAIHAVGANHYPPYLVMSFIPGESLQQRLTREGPLDVIDVLRIGQQVAEGLAAAHAQGLVHRDIKPGNILLERNVERVLLTDFGLARAADDASLTQSGVIAGTPQYMSPEQTRGEPVDHRTDLFSLGTVLYTLLAGHSPFRAETAMGVLRRVCDDPPRSLRDINPSVPEWLDRLIQKLQAKNPAERFESAAHVAELLQKCLSHMEQPTSVPLPSELQALPTPQTVRSTRRHFVSMAIVVGTIGVLAFAMWISNREQNPTDNSSQSIRQSAISSSQSSSDWDDSFSREANEIDQSLDRLETESATQF
jgi:serine/threonine-protein kinase